MKRTVLQMMRFGVVGGSHTILDASIYVGLTRSVEFLHSHYLVAAATSFCICGLSSFFWNKHWTFKHRVVFHHKQLLRFYIAACIALLLNQTILWYFVSHGIFDVVAKLIASVSAGFFNFLMQKFWTFSHRKTVVHSLETEYTEK